jgi:hypothetical protein
MGRKDTILKWGKFSEVISKTKETKFFEKEKIWFV